MTDIKHTNINILNFIIYETNRIFIGMPLHADNGTGGETEC